MNFPKLLLSLPILCLLVAMCHADPTATLEAQQPAALPANSKSPADHSTLLHPDQLQTLIETEGLVQRTDVEGHLLFAKNMTEEPITLKIIPNTRILDPQNHPLTLADLKEKDHVRLYYDRKTNTAQQIDRLPSVSQVILGQ